MRSAGSCPWAAFAALLLLLLLGCAAAPAHGHAARVYVFEVGECRTNDLARWVPGTPAGTPWTFANHCYLVQHEHGLLLWDTGFADALASLPDGLELAGGAVRIRVVRPLREQFAALGVQPDDVTHVACSHLHIDHAGNLDLFAAATVYLQAAECDAAFGAGPQRFGFDPAIGAVLRRARKRLLRGDCDVFGDGSVVILSTPGHTPGHQSLLVRLANAGPLVLSGDLAHLRSNWVERRVPASNFDAAATRRSMDRVAALLETEHATLVIQHDRAQGATLPKAPAFLD